MRSIQTTYIPNLMAHLKRPELTISVKQLHFKSKGISSFCTSGALWLISRGHVSLITICFFSFLLRWLISRRHVFTDHHLNMFLQFSPSMVTCPAHMINGKKFQKLHQSLLLICFVQRFNLM